MYTCLFILLTKQYIPDLSFSCFNIKSLSCLKFEYTLSGVNCSMLSSFSNLGLLLFFLEKKLLVARPKFGPNDGLLIYILLHGLYLH